MIVVAKVPSKSAPAPVGDGRVDRRAWPPVVNSGPPTRIHKVVLQETMATMVLYTLPAVEVRQLVINVAVSSIDSFLKELL